MAVIDSNDISIIWSETFGEALNEWLDVTSFHKRVDGVLSISFLEVGKFYSFISFVKSAGFTMLVDICGADYPHRDKRFDVVYQFLNLKKNLRIEVIMTISEGETSVPSLFELYKSAGWFEREIYDMFGILFANSPDMRRILTDYHFEHHPLRKDFPLTGFTEVRYDVEKGQIISEPVNLSQKYRDFNFETPWQGPNYNVIPQENDKK